MVDICFGNYNTAREKKKKQDTLDKGLLSKIYKELLKLNKKKTNNLVKKPAKTLTDSSPNKIYR